MTLKPGDKAPNFRLIDDEERPFILYDELEKGPLVLYFYPRDFTSGCTAEACGFRDSYSVLTDRGFRVAGISRDSNEKHKKFRNSYSLPFTLLTDEDHSVADSFGISRTFGIIPGRVTFVIGRDGTILHTFNSLTDIKGHIEGVLKATSSSS